MRVMKDSEVEWIGEIPKEWRLTRIGFLFKTIGSGTTPSSSDSRYYDGNYNWLQTGDLNDGIISTTEKTITDLAIEKHSVLRQYSIGSLVVAMYGATIGKLGLLNIPCYTNQACCVLEGPINVDTKFVYYWLFCNRQNLITFSLGGGQPNISQNTIREFKVCLPSKAEQKSIVSFLDLKCAEIDSLIAAKEKTNALLKERRQSIIYEAVTKGLDPTVPMKDSGVEWIGEIPEKWKISKIKYCARLDREKLSETTDSDYTFQYIDIGSVTEYGGIGGTTEMTFAKSPSRARMVVHDGDTIISTVRTYLKAVAYIDQLKDHICSTGFCVLSPCKELHPKFGYYLLQSDYIVQKIVSESVGVSYPAISSAEIGRIKISLPKPDEQAEIVAYLDAKCGKIDQIILENESTIQKLKEYRQSLIYEAVTGKIEV